MNQGDASKSLRDFDKLTWIIIHEQDGRWVDFKRLRNPENRLGLASPSDLNRGKIRQSEREVLPFLEKRFHVLVNVLGYHAQKNARLLQRHQ